MEVLARAVAGQEVHELPSARGWTYILPKADFALGLAVGAGAAAKHLGVTTGEIDRLNDAVLRPGAGSAGCP
ncbi:hypothetical protein [Amycolatopsis saalfeldensis]|uniref:Uncharacterized protein n=1 Tax=Amycolatopsis saalfeldensis TaxID=394193 RepID=A0A1H8XG71_9PSEU|nr:hypothetical protein [Amycolatopsis saalfeldensis]SEP38869.1 hypothetical protein SAMN04489732_107195 [Amycolatopsis saalfeldensis]